MLTVGIGAVLALALLALAMAVQRRLYLFQYLYFLRFPLILALTLAVVLPLMMSGVPRSLVGQADTMVGNLAVMSPLGMILCAFVTTLSAWIILMLNGFLLEWIPYKMKLPFRRGSRPLYQPRPKAALHRKAAEWVVGRAAQAVFWLYSLTRPARAGQLLFRRLVLYLPVSLSLMLAVVLRTAAAENPGGTSSGYVWDVALFTLVSALGVLAAFFIRTVLSRRLLRPLAKRLRERRVVKEISKTGLQLARRLAPESVRHGPLTPSRVEARVVGRLESLDPRKTSKKAAWDVREPDELFRLLADALGFFICVVGVYLVCGLIYQPSNDFEVPAIIPLIIALTAMAFVLTILSAYLDAYRVTVVVSVALVLFLVYQAMSLDHYYRVMRIDDPGPVPSAKASYERWAGREGRDDGLPPVIVCASGGGISSALWTAVVLTGIQREIPEFGDALLMLSTVSGGGVGAMYFVNRYSGDGEPPGRRGLEAIVDLAGRSSLGATSWGIAYGDILVPFGWPYDRGWALEEVWRKRLTLGERPEDAAEVSSPTLATWAAELAGRREGWRPVQIFNATAAETGERFLLAPIHLEPVASGGASTDAEGEGAAGGGQDLVFSRSFLTTYPGLDLHVATAARLSATFPYVSPLARPAPVGGEEDGEEGRIPAEEHALHLADGGYYDNHGVSTAVDYVQRIWEKHRDRSRRARLEPVPPIIVIQIQTDRVEDHEARRIDGFTAELVGPVRTVMNVRSTSQIERARLDLERLGNLMRPAVGLEVLKFVYRAPDLPLSWYLSDPEKEKIISSWVGLRERTPSTPWQASNQAEVARLQALLRPPERRRESAQASTTAPVTVGEGPPPPERMLGPP